MSALDDALSAGADEVQTHLNDAALVELDAALAENKAPSLVRPLLDLGCELVIIMRRSIG